MGKINWLAVVLSVVVGMGLGFLWYGALFQGYWMEGNGITMEGDKMFKNGIEVASSSFPMIFNTIATIIYPIFLNWIINKTGETTAMGGAKLGFIMGLVITLGIITTNLFASNSTVLSCVDGSFMTVLFTVMGAIMGGWRK